MSSLHDVLNAGAQDSKEHKALVRAVDKAAGDLDAARHLVARLYRMPFEVLPSAIRSTVLARGQPHEPGIRMSCSDRRELLPRRSRRSRG
jgi:hypothetical protein